MKRTLMILFFLVSEFILSLVIQFTDIPYLIYGLLFLNIILFLILIAEPYWKIGGWLTFLTLTEVDLFVLNSIIFGRYIFIAGFFNLFILLFGCLIVLIAHTMKFNEDGQERFIKHDLGEADIRESKEKNTTHSIDSESASEQEQDENEEQEKPKEKNPEVKTYIEVDSKIHLPECPEIADVAEEDKLIIGSKRYAESNGYTPCDKCRPFG